MKLVVFQAVAVTKPMSEPQSDSKTFRATLQRFRGNGLNWVIVRLPFSVEKRWKTRGTLRVNVEVNGFHYRTAVFPTRAGQHFLLVNKKMQKAARIGPGSTAAFTLTPDFSLATPSDEFHEPFVNDIDFVSPRSFSLDRCRVDNWPSRAIPPRTQPSRSDSLQREV